MQKVKNPNSLKQADAKLQRSLITYSSFEKTETATQFLISKNKLKFG